MPNIEARVARRLHADPTLRTLPTAQRRQEIQRALMDIPGADPDDKALVSRIDDALTRALPRVKTLTGMTDDELARLIGKARPTVQAYVGGRLREHIPDWAIDKLINIVQAKQVEVGYLLRDLKIAREKSH
ncbi:MAG: hypothetical protein INH13_25810 [Cupriavidus sp.]|nr:hypothetical protein [Cupriavidus sp.]